MSLCLSLDEEDSLQETAAILNCLEYLQREAANSGLHDAAQLIAMAAASVSEAIARQDSDEDGNRPYYPDLEGSGPH